ncbi:hypothetical protein C1Y63_11900 [Corynebacterium sp. 13CS0277]|uniref:hypothetical protein n=1 Tax=Corynebacterium sp. 13CS0277 TaxID=2071994 RepID=UPI000D03D6A0|nr:hypothetical protein [Corynebacterium sp. 13CS0277]PRQ10360.1 hypothetical protein C1Y63_11900 [Corynebacterium sp. 13CS0277]
MSPHTSPAPGSSSAAPASGVFQLPPQRRVPIIYTDATAYVVLFCISTIATIGLTRLYLKLTGYPQIGGEVFHLAHALWGGLLLTITTVMLLVLANRWARWTAAALGGVGAALFVDEVGKFITQKNDYFFPLAATIVYVFLVLLAGVAALLSRVTARSSRAHLYAALESATAIVDGDITEGELARMRQHLAEVERITVDPHRLAIARALGQIADQATTPKEDSATLGARVQAKLLAAEKRLLPLGLLRRMTRLIILFITIAGLPLLVALLLAAVGVDVADELMPEQLLELATAGSAGQWLTLGVAATWAVAAFFGARAWWAMSPRHLNVEAARHAGTIALLVMLVFVNGLMAYVDQFAILVDLIVESIGLVFLHRWAIRSLTAVETDDA